MNDISEKRWGDFLNGLRRHWPNLTDAEIAQTQGDFEKLETLIESKYGQSAKDVRENLAYIFDETSHGNPNTIDDYEGIEISQNAPKTPPSNEWEAREDNNRGH